MTPSDILASLESGDTFQAVEAAGNEQDALTSGRALGDAGADAYWKQKNLPRSIALLRAGIQQLLQASALASPELSNRLRTQARALSYNLASFTWPGWDEARIICSPGDLAIGLDAARTSLRLVRELRQGDLKEARSLWILGAHQLAIKVPAAEHTFLVSADRALAASAVAEHHLSLGFAALVRHLCTPADASATAAMNEAKKALEPLEHGEMFVAQIDTAKRVFGQMA